MNEPERAAVIEIGGQTYELVLTTRATKEIAARYGGLQNLGDKLMKAVRNSVGKYFNSDLDVQNVVDTVEEKIYDFGKDEVASGLIGETILEVLADTNEMAYVRFASVFKEFKTLDELERSIAEQRERMKKKAAKE